MSKILESFKQRLDEARMNPYDMGVLRVDELVMWMEAIEAHYQNLEERVNDLEEEAGR